jgi:hypothetical protein
MFFNVFLNKKEVTFFAVTFIKSKNKDNQIQRLSYIFKIDFDAYFHF